MYFKENGLTEQESEALKKLNTFKSEIPKSIWNTLKID
jgi:hypothetical protein